MSWQSITLRFETEAEALSTLFEASPDGLVPKYPPKDMAIAPMPLPIFVDNGRRDEEGTALLDPVPGYFVALRLREGTLDPEVFGAARIASEAGVVWAS